MTLDAMVERISDGAFLRDLAKETGIDKRRLSEALRKHPDYPSAKETSIEVQLDDAQLALQLAHETADIARAREMFRAAAWRAEREFPQRWGAKPEAGNLSLTINVVAFQQDGAVHDRELVIMSSESKPNSVVAAQRAERLAVDAELVDNPVDNSDGTLVPTRSPVAPGLVDSGGK